MKKVLLIIIIFLIMLMFGCSDKISLKGSDDIVIEIGDEYEDVGINIPSNYQYEVRTNLDINKVGSYYFEYLVYKNNKKVDDLFRSIKVKDTKAPEYETKLIDNLLVGIEYDESYFFENINDKSNYYLKSDKDIIFFEKGRYEIDIIISDEYNNASEFKRDYSVIKDDALLLNTLKEENRLNRYDDGSIKVNYGKDIKDYFYFYKFNNDYIYEINHLINIDNDIANLNYKYVISVTSTGLSEKTIIEYVKSDESGLYFSFNSYELEDKYINNPNASEELKEEIKNLYSLLVYYINVFGAN